VPGAARPTRPLLFELEARSSPVPLSLLALGSGLLSCRGSERNPGVSAPAPKIV
jgi:hypothetical protein